MRAIRFGGILAALTMAACIEAPPESTNNAANSANSANAANMSNNANAANATNNANAANASNNANALNSANAVNAQNSASEPWWNSGWPMRAEISLTPGLSNRLADFPVLIRFSPQELGNGADLDPRSLRFVSGGESLPFELTNFRATNSEAWVRLPALAANEVTTLWIYWGNLDMGRDVSPEDTWHPMLFEAVYHFEVDEVGADSSSKGRALECSTPDCPTTPGLAGASFNAGAGHLFSELPREYQLESGDALTVSYWYQGEVGEGGPMVFAESYCVGWGTSFLDDNGGQIYASLSTVNDTVDFQKSCSESDGYRVSKTIQAGADLIFHHVALIIDRPNNTLRIFHDGVEIGEPREISNGEPIDDRYGALRFNIGGAPSQDPFSGRIDEVWIVNKALSKDWIGAHIRNLQEQDFVQIGPAESHVE